MKPHLRRHVHIAVFILLAAGVAAGHPVDDSTTDPISRITGRISADLLRSILAQAQTAQTDLGLSADLKPDESALSAVLQTFQKNYSGLGGFIRNVQIRTQQFHVRSGISRNASGMK